MTFYAYKLYSTTVNISMCKSCSNMVNLSEKSLPKPKLHKVLAMFDTLTVQKEDGTIKLLAFRKKTHTDQYLNFSSHHPLHQKLGVIKTLLDRCNNIVTDPEDRRKEEEYITKAFQECGYPKWTIRKIREKQ